MINVTRKEVIMSNQSNARLLERGYQLAEEVTGHPSGADTSILKAIEDNDLEVLMYLVNMVEAELSREHFHNHDAI
jgi:hypothetical protein